MGGCTTFTGFSLNRAISMASLPVIHSDNMSLGFARALCGYGVRRKLEPKITALLTGYGETLDPRAKFFVDYRLPAYTYDKLSAGLIDAHEFAHNPIAMEIHERLTRAIATYLPEKALSRAEQRSRPHKDTALHVG